MAAASSKVLITGGCGFIGRFMVADLLGEGFDVTVVDNLSASLSSALPAGCRFFRSDLTDQDAVRALIDGNGIEYIIHLAGPHSVPDSRLNPQTYRETIVGDARSLLAASLGTSVRGLLFPSTARVYAGIRPELQSEDAMCSPVDAYGQAKLEVERLLCRSQETAHRQPIKIGILRLFNVAGAHPQGLMGRDFRSVAHMVKSLCSVATGRQATCELHAYGLPTRDGTAIRDYVHVQDVARAFRMTLEALDAGAERLVFNVGTGRGTTVLEMIRMAEQVFERPIPVKFACLATEDVAVLVAKIERIQRALGWSPHYSVREILEHAWLWECTAPIEARGSGASFGASP